MKPILLARAQNFLIAVGLLSVALAVFAYRTSTEHVQSVAETLVTAAFLDKVNALFVSVEDAETAQRGYLLTNRRAYLQPFLQAKQDLPERFRQIDASATSNAIPKNDLRRLHALVTEKMRELQTTVDLEEAGKHAAAITTVETDQGFALMRQIRELLQTWQQAQDREFRTRLERQEGRQQLLNVVLIASMLATFALLLIAYQLANRFAREREKVEAHILDLNRTLESRVRERTLELERSNADLTQFAYAASHDLQEPLRMVRSYMGLLAKRYSNVLDEQAETYIRYATDGAARMQALINDLLQYSRAGTQAVQKERVASEDVIRAAVANLELAVAESGAEVRFDGLPIVCADPTKLTQVFQNLLANAIKFRKHNETPKIAVSAERMDTDWQFSVVDNGIGLDMAYKDKIFDIFQRLHSSNEFAGNGIGLSICRRIVEQHGGRLWVESELGSGTTFHFTMPASDHQDGNSRRS